jgi:hypothetical protein
MALARVQYTQQVAGNKNFTVPFPYISRDHIFVSVNGTDVDFSWLNSTTVQLTNAPAEGDLVDIRRETERVNLLVDFQDASTITEEQLDLSAKQAFFIAQEAFDATGATLAVANDGSYSAQNRRLSNVGEPAKDSDAATQGWVKAQYQSGRDAHQERLKAEAARDAAQASESAAANSEANALSYRNTANSHRIAAANSASAAATSETNAANSAAAAKASEDDVAANAAAAANSASSAASSASSANTSKNSAASSASAAGSYANSANDSRAKASLWAEAAEDSAVEPGKYSAKHHAAKAAASASSAAMSATNAANYRDTANSHRLAAANSAAEAANSATASSNSASAASTSEANAANSAAEAAGYAAGVNLPSGLSQGGRILRQKGDETGLEYMDSYLDFGLGASAAPVLADFADNTVKTGFYRALGDGSTTPTPNCPPGSGNNLLSVFAVQLNGGAVHYIVKANAASDAGQKLWFGNAYTGTTVQWAEALNHTAFPFIDTNGWASLRVANSNGYIDFGPANASYAHIYTDRPTFYFNKDLRVNGNLVYHAGRKPSLSWGAVQITGYVNSMDGVLDWTAPNGTVVVGAYSYHSNSTEDRQWKFRYRSLSI